MTCGKVSITPFMYVMHLFCRRDYAESDERAAPILERLLLPFSACFSPPKKICERT